MTAAATLPSPAPGADFPSWLPPMLVKELRQGLRARSFVSGMVTIHTGMALLLGWVLLHPGRELAGAAEAVRGALWFIAAALLLLLTPRRAEGLGAELKERTLDPLLLTQLDGTRIVLGKWASLLAQAALVVVALLPYGLLQYFVGEMDVLRDMTTLAALVFGSAVLTAVALMFSTLARWQTTVVGAAGVVLLVAGPLAIFAYQAATASPSAKLLLAPIPVLVVTAVSDGVLMAALALVLAAWRLDRRGRSRVAWRLVLLSLPAAGTLALWSGELALAQGGVCLLLAVTTLVAAPRRKKTRPAAATTARAVDFVAPPVAVAAASATPRETAQTATPATRADFPAWLPPMLVKELRQGLRSRAFVAVFILAQVAMAGAFFYANLSSDNARAAAALADGFYWAVMGGLLVLLAPLRARGALGAELKGRTTDLLLLTHLTGWRIVTSQWASLMAQTLLLTVSLLPFGLLRYYLGGTELYADFWRLLGLLFAGGVLTALVMMFAMMSRWLGVAVIIGGLVSTAVSLKVAGGVRIPWVPSFGAAVALFSYDSGIITALSLVLAAWRMDSRSNLFRPATCIILLAVPAVAAVSFWSGALAMLQLFLGFGLFLMMSLVMPDRKHRAAFGFLP